MKLTKEETRVLVAWFGGLSKLTAILLSLVAIIGMVNVGLEHIYMQVVLMLLSILCIVSNAFSIAFNAALLQYQKNPPKEYDISPPALPTLTETVNEPPQMSIRQRVHSKSRKE